jgi:HSP20 family protein
MSIFNELSGRGGTTRRAGWRVTLVTLALLLTLLVVAASGVDRDARDHRRDRRPDWSDRADGWVADADDRSVFARLSDALRSQMNSMMNEFSSGLGPRQSQRIGAGGGGWPSLWDDETFDTPLLMGGSGVNVGGKPLDESKVDDAGMKGQTQMARHQQQQGLSTFRPSDVVRARVNLEEQKDKYIVTADVPGFDKENLKVNLGDDGLLHISAEQKKEHIEEAKNKKYLRTERTFSNVQRSLRIPRGVDASKIQANYENGVLHVLLPKTAEAIAAKHDIQIQ